jgi:hypothetical protein
VRYGICGEQHALVRTAPTPIREAAIVTAVLSIVPGTPSRNPRRPGHPPADAVVRFDAAQFDLTRFGPL